ncbi:response regulator receiver protein [Beutenbergia cavernae DSM 12333]|uniref:Response regulator receiver protein n=1 Tax=Beutenbergia cavernae (strain ATCC BAA-8 / DSM 12333 / CCUG 43141 / JCM 11478 / NBRC 16432 / NCIMB 13614 / HKI 0122) TaxID=471853 RepID=C5BZE5_BEUC1|nr:response regulator [Beutenbergia cavernae]ACQ79117.1 response regulator receiver protein [Beutenbergia cavernae DSM 12333]
MHPGHVLVVDDDETIREVAQMALQLVGGWRVTTAPSGAEALRLAHMDPPDVILLDVMMPVVDGPSTLVRLRADPVTREVPVVFLTAKFTPGQAHEWSGSGLAGVIAKPFDPMTLADQVARLLERPA